MCAVDARRDTKVGEALRVDTKALLRLPRPPPVAKTEKIIIFLLNFLSFSLTARNSARDSANRLLSPLFMKLYFIDFLIFVHLPAP